jgi:hypothetical protein
LLARVYWKVADLTWFDLALSNSLRRWAEVSQRGRAVGEDEEFSREGQQLQFCRDRLRGGDLTWFDLALSNSLRR